MSTASTSTTGGAPQPLPPPAAGPSPSPTLNLDSLYGSITEQGTFRVGGTFYRVVVESGGNRMNLEPKEAQRFAEIFIDSLRQTDQTFTESDLSQVSVGPSVVQLGGQTYQIDQNLQIKIRSAVQSIFEREAAHDRETAGRSTGTRPAADSPDITKKKLLDEDDDEGSGSPPPAASPFLGVGAF